MSRIISTTSSVRDPELMRNQYSDVSIDYMKAFLRKIYLKGRAATRYTLIPLLKPRRFHAFSCGLSKTGTHSIAGIFEDLRCEHHPDANVRIRLAMDYMRNDIDVDHARKILKKRDRRLWLEMESSSLAGILIQPLVIAYPKAKFILTIRDIYSWCNSWMDHNINSPPNPSSRWARLDKVRLKANEIEPTKFDAPLLERGLLPLACYFQLWQSHNQEVLDAVPEERLLVIKTADIIEMIPVMADWLNIPVKQLRSEQGWLFAAPKKHRTLTKLDPAYVKETAESHGSTLMQRFFPEITLEQVLKGPKGKDTH